MLNLKIKVESTQIVNEIQDMYREHLNPALLNGTISLMKC